MSEVSDNNVTEILSQKRLLWIMAIISIIAVFGSLWFRDWRITSGLILGCCLSFANFIWSKNTLSAMFEKNANSAKPSFSVIRYFFRYLIFALVIGLAYYFDLISIVAALLGMLTFITAIFAASFIEIFKGLFRREEI